MMPILRSVLAVIAGAVAAMVLIIAMEFINTLLYPMPPGVDLSKPEAFKAWVAQLPVGALLIVLMAQGAGTFVGAWVAALVAGRAPLIHGLIMGLLFLIMGIINLLSLPHPAWFWVPGIAVFPVAALLGAWMARRR